MKVAKQKRQKSLEAKRAIRQNKPKPKEPFKYLITLAYDGSDYGGYAKQKHRNTIQNVLEDTLKKHFGDNIKTTESSRTDAKVHALNQMVMFEQPVKIAVEKARAQLNELLPHDIVIVDLKQVHRDFHCRYEVVDKTYEYRIHSAIDPRLNHYSWYINQKLNIQNMHEASRCLIGKHDFSTFKSAKATTDTSVRTIHFVEIHEEADKVVIRINADGFLYNMVRLIVKALVDVGIGKQEVTYVRQLLEAQSKPDNLASAPARGLCLMAVNYN
ncbi:MAG: tRNA pseudouridine(38-40) synthase TruA [Turicibacter sp.]|nr:tRNA pseudouridine(38-40) synthase TruA [Turicibacter sp.]